MPGLTIVEKRRRAERPPELEYEEHPPKRHRQKRTFDEIFQVLLKYKSKHGNCNVPLRYTEDRALGQWVTMTRNTAGKRITAEQKQQLTEIGFDWETRQEKDERRWQAMFTELNAYRLEHGDCRVPQNWKENRPLASWVNSQRCKEAIDKLPAHHKQKLESIHFTWRQRTCDRSCSSDFEKWQEKYQRLVSFHKRFGHTMVPENFREDKALGNWVGKQRSAYSEKRLEKERKEFLDELNFVWKIDKADVNASHTQQMGRDVQTFARF